MHLSLSSKTSRLPKRFPVGTTYVVEGRGGEDGSLRVFSRYVVLPNGQRINLGADPDPGPVAEEPAERSALGLEPKVVPGSAPSRARRPRARAENTRQNSQKRRAVRPKKIITGGGTSRRHGR
jgi:hypothetical protein